MELPIPLEMLILLLVVITLGVNVIVPVIDEAKATSGSVILNSLYDAIILFSFLFDVLIIIAWLKFD